MDFLTSKIKRLYQIEKYRLQKKGTTNIIIALVLLVSLIYGFTKIGKAIWPDQIENKIQFVIKISFIIHFTCQIIYFLIYLPGYLKIFSFYDYYQISPQLSKPWERKQWPQLRSKTIKYVFLNYCIIYPAAILISFKISGLRFRFDNFPSAWQVGFQIFLIYYMQDFFFYWLHRISHEYQFMYNFHKIHHQYDSLYTFVTQYTHPVDYFIANLLPSAIPFMILGNHTHCFVFFLWQVWKLFISTEGHCGYQFPWSPTRIFFFISGPSNHHYHHSKNIGNYAGSAYFWDTIFQTNKTYYDELMSQK